MGLARTSRYLLLRLIADSYVMLIRNIPPVVFVFVFVFFIAGQIMPALGLGDRVAQPRRLCNGGSRSCSVNRS